MSPPQVRQDQNEKCDPVTWRRVDPQFARRIQLAAFIVGFWFGVDYVFTPYGSSPVLSWVERGAVPLWAYGAVIMAACLAGFYVEWRILGNEYPLLPTEARRRWGWVSNISHITLFASFVVLSSSTIVDIVNRGVEGHGWYGWRTTVMWAGYAYVNWEFIRRLGDSPRRGGLR